MLKTSKVIAGILSVFLGGVAFAQERGSVTNLPIPRFVSMKADEGNVRRGPSKTQRIDWVYKHRDMPLKIVKEYEHWRRVEDIDGQGGWMHFRLLSTARTVIFTEEKTPLRRRAYDGAEARAFAEQGVIGKLDECNPEWCKIFIGRENGWVKKTEVWGVDADELRE
tara:strand:+ start:18222 stop:18719 length:498 start_codon:yes stop_codon:yes gene_type:complete